MSSPEHFLREAVDLARDNVRKGGRPFGAIVVRNGAIVATGVNEVVSTGDPTAHAELSAIRAASRTLGTLQLDGCVVYASGHPCPMCLAAMYLTGIREAACAYSLEDAAAHGLSTAAVYAEFAKPSEARSLSLAHVPVRSPGEEHLYDLWKAASR